jgi:hypothetical protein
VEKNVLTNESEKIPSKSVEKMRKVMKKEVKEE